MPVNSIAPVDFQNWYCSKDAKSAQIFNRAFSGLSSALGSTIYTVHSIQVSPAKDWQRTGRALKDFSSLKNYATRAPFAKVMLKGGAIGALLVTANAGINNWNAYSEGKVTGQQALIDTAVEAASGALVGAIGTYAGGHVGAMVCAAGLASPAVGALVIGMLAGYAAGFGVYSAALALKQYINCSPSDSFSLGIQIERPIVMSP